MADLHVEAICAFHFRSLEMVMPKYLTVSTIGILMELIQRLTLGLKCFLEMIRRENLEGLMANPEA